MKRTFTHCYVRQSRLVLFLLSLIPIPEAFSQANHSMMIFDFENKLDVKNITTVDSKYKLVNEGKNHSLRITLGHHENKPSVKLPMTAADLSGYLGIAMDIRNLGTSKAGVEAQCNDANGRNVYKSILWLEPGETDTLLITFYRDPAGLPPYIGNYLKGMNGLPGGFLWHWETLDLSKITNIDILKEKSAIDYNITVDNIRAVGKYNLPGEELLKNGFFPIVDIFGQYFHADWTGKTHTVEDIKAQKTAEEFDLRTNPGPSDWDKYGGWKAGPQLQATGNFRVEKYQDKWWLVDPDGRLFWSQGIDCMSFSQNTPVTGRENYFTRIPQHGDFLRANLLLKYGNEWNSSRDSAAGVIHQRLRSWGINTIGNWSDSYLYGQKKTPYTATLSSGMPKNVPNSLDEAEFRATCARKLSGSDIAATANDPWCIGYFVDNELSWPSSNAEQVLETYYKVVKEELKKLAPNKLFLGSRLDKDNTIPIALAAAGRHCDVISINRYEYTIAGFALPQGIDKPVIVGEFHVGALDRGLLHTGLRSVLNQKQRSRVYENYVIQALENPLFVGTHWFQYADQMCTGRYDGENYQIGFIDVCDRPYPEMVAAARKIGSNLYKFRLTGKN
jgi:hypothetical protein